MSSASPKQPRKFVLYHYEPSLLAAILFTAIFAGCGVTHARQIYQTKTWYFTAMLIGVLMEATGYFGRIISHFDNMALGPYVTQTLFILIAPALIAASIYIILGRIIATLEAERHSLVPIKWLTKTFVIGDVFSFFMQASSSGSRRKS
ncbi:rta1 domain protein [Moniliophthora roreri MCA 2997]|uniref:Rta1 domain protein n=1 Tax=Moniliophthora roreri (strain MCA 2997) TaxID=1381753 RepID=V2YFP5_MONRO|nr:rta1 domain protein [Moniliophthora roreri MCA 2997]